MSRLFRRPWTENDVRGLIGSSETIRLEFKSGSSLETADKNDKWLGTVTAAISAFANTEGGELVLGIRESAARARKSIAEEIDGVPATIDREWLQRKIEGHISPYLPGIHFERVRLSSPNDRVVFIIQIPQGNTAYQANDRKYYGRSETECIPLPDHEIRLRMNRGRIPEPEVRCHVWFGRSAAEGKDSPASTIDSLESSLALTKSLADRYDEMRFKFFLKNVGGVTIRSPVAHLRESRRDEIFNGFKVRCDNIRTRSEMRDQVIYPGDERLIQECSCEVKPGVTLALGDFVVAWTVFLDDSLPRDGKIDIGDEIQKSRCHDHEVT